MAASTRVGSAALATFTFFFVSLVTTAYAGYPVAGIGRSSLGFESETTFSAPELLNDIDGISGLGDTISNCFPIPKVYGVNFGGWLLFEPWMAPSKWEAMGGQVCSSCSACLMSEWSLSNALGREQTNAVFQAHWQDWFTQADVDGIKSVGLNTVRIPLPFWIIEQLVDTATEPYAQGGLDELIRGLTMLKHAGLHVLLDHHALPGVSSKNQMFAGNCTSNIQFYSSPGDYNYKRAVTWSIVMTWLSHVHPAFSTVFGIEALNEPQQNYALTPGIGNFEEAFVLGVRAAETSLGIICAGEFTSRTITNNITLAAIQDAVPILRAFATKYALPSVGIDNLATGSTSRSSWLGILNQRKCLATTFMIRDWQYSTTGDTIPNPSDAAHGPQIYDSHLYLNFGGTQTEDAYMSKLCNLTTLASNTAIGDTPLIFGEWAISTAFNTTTDDFLRQWGDVQKQVYSQGAGWIFWNWKVAADAQVPEQKMWSYRDAVVGGVMYPDPEGYFEQDVCAKYFSS